VGLLTTGFAYGPERRLFEGMLAAARARDVSLLCFHGRRLNSPILADRSANVLYGLVDRQCCDGLVVWSGALGEHVSTEELRSFCLRFALPVVTIGGHVLDEIPSIVFDFYSGMRSLMRHLVDVHAFRRIAFIRGLEGQDEAEQRFRAYCDVVAECGLTLDDKLIVPGDFQREAGRRAVSILFDERRANPDAIVAVNDETALGVLEELSARGIAVPDRVALTGFDDDDAVRWTNPPLSTVRFSIDAAAESALDILLSGVGPGGETRERLSLEPKLRASCGCHPKTANDATVRAGRDWRERIHRAFSTDVANLARSSIAVWHGILDETLLRLPDDPELVQGDSLIAGQLEATVWHDTLQAAHERVVAEGALTPQQRAHADELAWHISRMIADAGQRQPTFRGWLREQHIWQVQEIGQKLLHTFDLAAMARAAADAIPAAGIRRFAVALYEKGDAPSEEARLLIGCDGDSVWPKESETPTFASRTLAPAGFLDEERRFTFAVEPLVFEDHQLGFVLFEVQSEAQGALIVALRKHLSAALQGAVLVNQLEQRAEELGQAHHIQEEQRQRLVVAERMAWLGRLTAGVAHEMNTPVAAVRSSLHHLTDLIEEYRVSIGDASVVPHDHQELAGEMAQAAKLAERAAQSAAKFIAEFKAQTRDLTPHAKVVFNAVPVVSEALGLLKHLLEASESTVVYEPASDFVNVSGSPGRLAQLVTNLVVNGIDAQASKGGGVLAIRIGPRDESIDLEIVDQGEGIRDDVLPRIFEPMFSTRPFGQHIGLGLSIARDIIESEFDGTIKIDTHVGVGTKVTVRLPKAE
jgi:DNA-binding LacI/PurR family transcriptional regulator/signal transduction histidine kinase